MEKNEVVIRMSKSVTKNLGNYNSAKIEFGMERVVDIEDKEAEISRMSVEIDDFLELELESLSENN